MPELVGEDGGSPSRADDAPRSAMTNTNPGETSAASSHEESSVSRAVSPAVVRPVPDQQQQEQQQQQHQHQHQQQQAAEEEEQHLHLHQHQPQEEEQQQEQQQQQEQEQQQQQQEQQQEPPPPLQQRQLESLYSMRHVEEKAKQAVDNISTLTSFKSTILARTAVYDSPEGVRHSLAFLKRRFKWFDFDESNLEETTTYYCCDEQGVHNVHLTGYLIICHRVGGGGGSSRYVFRSCVAEFYEQVTFDQLAYKVLASSTSIVGGIAASAATGAAMAWPTDVFTWGTGSVVGGLAGAVVGIVGAVFVNVDADSKEKQIEKKLGTGLYNASTNRINSHGIMEVLLLHYLLADQKYNIDGKEVRIAGVNTNEHEHSTRR